MPVEGYPFGEGRLDVHWRVRGYWRGVWPDDRVHQALMDTIADVGSGG
jgi:hypothetical protein